LCGGVFDIELGKDLAKKFIFTVTNGEQNIIVAVKTYFGTEVRSMPDSGMSHNTVK
jgi:hypothetical protein